MSRSDFSLASLRASAEQSERCIVRDWHNTLVCEVSLAASDVHKVVACAQARAQPHLHSPRAQGSPHWQRSRAALIRCQAMSTAVTLAALHSCSRPRSLCTAQQLLRRTSLQLCLICQASRQKPAQAQCILQNVQHMLQSASKLPAAMQLVKRRIAAARGELDALMLDAAYASAAGTSLPGSSVEGFVPVPGENSLVRGQAWGKGSSRRHKQKPQEMLEVCACLPAACLLVSYLLVLFFVCLLFTCIRLLFDSLLFHQSATLAKNSCSAGG